MIKNFFSPLMEPIKKDWLLLGLLVFAGLPPIVTSVFYKDIKLILVLPCRDQADRWKAEDQEEYEKIKRAADKVVYSSDHYYRGCMHKRNRHLVDCSSLCICYLTNLTGGTAYTVDYARKMGCIVENLA